MKLGLCILLAVVWTNVLAYDSRCPPKDRVKCNYGYDIPCTTTSDCRRRGRRTLICCPDEGGHPVCTRRRPGRCPAPRARRCKPRNINKRECSRDKDCPSPAKCCLNAHCKMYCEYNTILGRGYAG